MKKTIAALLLVVGAVAGAGTAHAASLYYGAVIEDYYVQVGTSDWKEEISPSEAKSGQWEQVDFLIDPVNKTAVYFVYPTGPVQD